MAKKKSKAKQAAATKTTSKQQKKEIEEPKEEQKEKDVEIHPVGDGNGESAIVVDEDDEDVIDDEQLQEFGEMVEQLGDFPDKVKINSLSMVAEDHSDSKQSSSLLYGCIRKLLMDEKTVSRSRKLPLVYLLDSILKNVKGHFLSLVEQDAKNWMPIVHDQLDEEQRKKLKRVWNIWRDPFKLFQEDAWREMGRCFTISNQQLNNSLLGTNKVAGISRATDGTLQLSSALRKEMQVLLDDVQSTVTNELDKVSLERLADIDPDLLAKIKTMAQDSLTSGQSSSRASTTSTTTTASNTPFTETRSPETLQRTRAWEKLNLNHLEQSHDLITKLQQFVRTGPSILYTQQDALHMTSVLAVASATAAQLTNSLQRIKDLEDSSHGKSSALFGNVSDPSVRRFMVVDPNLFTNKGVKHKNAMVIGALYDVGLPFVSSADGRRFATQVELSNHLDYLFKQSQLEKTMERTEERGWYVDDGVWTGESTDAAAAAGEAMDTGEAAAEEEADPSTFTVPADESRDRCVICGINFKMFFDNDDGIYKYNNCREMQVFNDDAAEEESETVLVHVTCWRGLGSPDELTADQALQERHG